MKRKSFLFIALFLILFAGISSAEEAVRLKMRVYPKTVNVGDEIKVMMQAYRPENVTLSAPTTKTNVAPFEIKAVNLMSTEEKSNLLLETYQIILTVFETGDFQIPPITISYSGPQGIGSTQTKPQWIKVTSVLKPGEKAENVKPIKGLVSLSLNELRALLLALAAILLTIFLVVKIILRRRKTPYIDKEALLPAHERAYLELGRLRKKGVLEEKKMKEFYSGLTDVLKNYLKRRFSMDVAELTTSEILIATKEKGFMESVRMRIKSVLDAADLVKFANITPSQIEAEQTESTLREVVESTRLHDEEIAAEKEKTKS